MSYVWGGGTFVKREGTTADKLDFAFACARAQDFMKILQSCLCRKLLKILRKNQVSMALFLSATIHQGDELFSAQSRGKQCAFMSLSAVLTAQHNPLIDWSTTTFNNVLLQGDKMYLKALNSGLVVLEEGVEFLSVDNLPKVVGVSCCASMFSYQIRDSSLIDKFHNISPVVHGCTTPLRVTNRHLPLAIEPIEAQNNIELPVVVAQNNNLPVEVEPGEGKSINDLPIVVQPTEARDNTAKNKNQIWLIKYGKEYQGLIITDRKLESHYYDIHTALLDMFLNYSSAILILEGYMMALIKQTNFFYLFDSHARDFNSMPDLIKLKSIKKRKQSEETNSEREIRLQKVSESVKRKWSKETGSERQIRLQKVSESVKRKWSKETDSEKQMRLNQDRLHRRPNQDRPQKTLFIMTLLK